MKCEKCGQNLMLAEFVLGEIKCPRCGKINQLRLIKNEENEQRQEPIASTSE